MLSRLSSFPSFLALILVLLAQAEAFNVNFADYFDFSSSFKDTKTCPPKHLCQIGGNHQIKRRDLDALDLDLEKRTFGSIPKACLTVSDVAFIEKDLYKVSLNFEIAEAVTLFKWFGSQCASLKLVGLGLEGIKDTLAIVAGYKLQHDFKNFFRWSTTVVIKAQDHGDWYCLPDNFGIEYNFGQGSNLDIYNTWKKHFESNWKYSCKAADLSLRTGVDSNVFRREEDNALQARTFGISAGLLDKIKCETPKLPNFCWPKKCHPPTSSSSVTSSTKSSSSTKPTPTPSSSTTPPPPVTSSAPPSDCTPTVVPTPQCTPKNNRCKLFNFPKADFQLHDVVNLGGSTHSISYGLTASNSLNAGALGSLTCNFGKAFKLFDIHSNIKHITNPGKWDHHAQVDCEDHDDKWCLPNFSISYEWCVSGVLDPELCKKWGFTKSYTYTCGCGDDSKFDFPKYCWPKPPVAPSCSVSSSKPPTSSTVSSSSTPVVPSSSSTPVVPSSSSTPVVPSSSSTPVVPSSSSTPVVPSSSSTPVVPSSSSTPVVPSSSSTPVVPSSSSTPVVPSSSSTPVVPSSSSTPVVPSSSSTPVVPSSSSTPVVPSSSSTPVVPSSSSTPVVPSSSSTPVVPSSSSTPVVPSSSSTPVVPSSSSTPVVPSSSSTPVVPSLSSTPPVDYSMHYFEHELDCPSCYHKLQLVCSSGAKLQLVCTSSAKLQLFGYPKLHPKLQLTTVITTETVSTVVTKPCHTCEEQTYTTAVTTIKTLTTVVCPETTSTAPASETTAPAAPAEETPATPAETTPAAPAEETTPVETPAAAETTPAAPVETPAETTPAAPAETTSAAPAEETTPAAPAEETTPAAPAEETTPAAPAETTPAAPAEKTTPVETPAAAETTPAAPVDTPTETPAAPALTPASENEGVTTTAVTSTVSPLSSAPASSEAPVVTTAFNGAASVAVPFSAVFAGLMIVLNF
ncbi:hypothetical protein ABC855_g1075 [[Candida] zeylanoides]